MSSNNWKYKNCKYVRELTTRKNKRFVTRMGNRRNISRLAAFIPNVTLTSKVTSKPISRQNIKAINVDLYLCLLELKRNARYIKKEWKN